MLQTVAQCTETAGAAHQGSVEMTSADKCTSDSSPAPTPPPQAPSDTRSASYRQHSRTGRRVGVDGSQSCDCDARWCRHATPSGKEVLKERREAVAAVSLISAVFDGRCALLGFISVKRMQALSVLYMTAVRRDTKGN